MEFKKYQHVERFGTSEVEKIEFGTCYVFPKIDGTNASIWIENGILQVGSRKRHLTIEKDNAGFLAWVKNQKNILDYLTENPTHRLFGEWLVPHALKTYKDNAWEKFYIFDVVTDRKKEQFTHDADEKFNYLHYDDYKILLEKHKLDYLPYIAKITNGSYEQFVNQLKHNVFLLQEGKGIGEGIVIKNYDFVNKYGRVTWAKIVTSEFKEKHAKVHGGHEIKGKKMIEEEIAIEFTTKAICEKVYSKIKNDKGFVSSSIPRLLNTVFHDIIKEESWNFIKKHKNPIINFKTLQHFVFIQVKKQLPTLF